MRLSQLWKALSASPTGLLGLLLLILQVTVSIYVATSYPDEFGARFWSNPVHWVDNPKSAPPEWAPGLRGRIAVPHWSLTLTEPTASEERGRSIITDYAIPYRLEVAGVPGFLSLAVSGVRFEERAPLLGLTLVRPDESRISLLRHAVKGPREDETCPCERHVEEELRIQVNAEESVVTSLQEFLDETYGLQLNEESIRDRALEILFGSPVGDEGEFEPMTGTYEFLFQTATRAEGDGIGSVRVVAGGHAFGALGTDSIGRDLAQGLLFGLPVALIIGVVVSLTSTALGTALGVFSGYMGGKTDTVIQRLSDIVGNIPVLPLLIFLLFVIGPNLAVIMAILVAFSWPGLTIQVRSMVLHMRSSQLIEAIQSLGSSRVRVMWRHILPQIMPYFLAQIIFTAPAAILAEAGLSFLGLGDPSIPTWGQVLEAGFRTGGVYLGYWWWIIPPGLLIVLVALTFMLIALAIEPVVNPRLQVTRRG